MIRKATSQDYLSLCRMIQNKHINYITPNHIKNDINMGQLYILIIHSKIVGFCARVYCDSYNNYAIKRLCIPNKKNQGKGYAKELLTFLVETRDKNFPLVCTPWNNNESMKKILTNLKFEYLYTFNKNWMMYRI